MSLVVAFVTKKKLCFVAFRVHFNSSNVFIFALESWDNAMCHKEEHMERTNRVGTFVDHCCFPADYV